VCWAACPSSHPIQCGASCAKTKQDCDLAVTDQVMSLINVAITITTTNALPGAGTAYREMNLSMAGEEAIKSKTEKTVSKLAERSDIGALLNFFVRSGIATIIGNPASHATAHAVLKDAWRKANGGKDNPKQVDNLAALFGGGGDGTFDFAALDPKSPQTSQHVHAF
jgi:hypothetical protein